MPIVSFGALNPDGKDCPVPPADDSIFGVPTHSAKTWDAPGAWCDCMYPAAKYPDLNRRCKWSIGNGPAGFVDPTPPWTVTGKLSRGLSDDAISKAITAAANKGKELVTAQVTGATGSTTGTTTTALPDLQPPAGVGGPAGLATQPQPGMRFVGRRIVDESKTGRIAVTVEKKLGTGTPAPEVQEEEKETSMTPVLLVGGAALLFFLMKR